MAEVDELKDTLPELEAEQKKVGDELDKALAQIPNLPLDDVPDGADEHGNVEHHTSGKPSAIMRLRRSSISNWAKRSA